MDTQIITSIGNHCLPPTSLEASRQLITSRRRFCACWCIVFWDADDKNPSTFASKPYVNTLASGITVGNSSCGQNTESLLALPVKTLSLSTGPLFLPLGRDLESALLQHVTSRSRDQYLGARMGSFYDDFAYREDGGDLTCERVAVHVFWGCPKRPCTKMTCAVTFPSDGA